MDRISFDIFQPDGKRFHLSPNWIVFGLWGITIFFLWVFDNNSPSFVEFRSIIAWSIGLISLGFLTISFFTYKALNGKLDGTIAFENTSIIVNDKQFELTDINSLDFWFGDFYGKRSMNGRDFDPKLYQGVSNYITFTTKTNETQTVYFKMQTEHSYLSLDEFINNAIKLNKMSFSRGVDLLGVENVSDK